MTLPSSPGDYHMASCGNGPGLAIVSYRVYESKYAECKSELTDDEQAEQKRAMREVVTRIHSLYEQGVPFFSKGVFRDVVAQLDRFRAHPPPANDAGRPIISIPKVDGTLAEFELETGLVQPQIPGRESAVYKGHPFLGYRTFQQLALSDDPCMFLPHLAYCPTRLLYPMEIRRISTGEMVDSWSSQPLDVVQSALDYTIQVWEGSEDCRRLRSSLENVPLPRINKIVAFACSTMAVPGHQQRPMYQHALALTVRDIIERRQGADGQKIECFAQDPMYTGTDKEILDRLGIRVLEDPRGFLEVDDDTLIISFAPNIPVRQIIADIARPAVMVWDRVESEAESAVSWGLEDPGHRTDPESSRVRDMVTNHYHEPIALRPKDMFGDGAVYIRRK